MGAVLPYDVDSKPAPNHCQETRVNAVAAGRLRSLLYSPVAPGGGPNTAYKDGGP
jgi:hypothetical protein